MAIFFTFSPTSNHLHPQQVKNCDSNSRLVVDEDDYNRFKSLVYNYHQIIYLMYLFTHPFTYSFIHSVHHYLISKFHHLLIRSLIH